MDISNRTIAKYILLVVGLVVIWISWLIISFVYHNSGYESKLPEYIRFEDNSSKRIHLHSEYTKNTLGLSQFKFDINPSGFINISNISLKQGMGCCGLGQMRLSFDISEENYLKQINPDSIALKFYVFGHELDDSVKLHWSDSTIIYLN
jgi:hypothetical protein